MNGYFIDDLKSSQKHLALLCSIKQNLSQHDQRNPALPLQNSLNLLVQELELPFLLLSIQGNDEAVIVESSISSKQAIHNTQHSYRPGEGIITMVAANNKPYFCPDIHKAPEFRATGLLKHTRLKEQFSKAAIGLLCLPIHSPGKQVIGTLSAGLYDQQGNFSQQLEDEFLDNSVFSKIRELGEFLDIVCGLLVNTVHLRIKSEQQRANTIRLNHANESLQAIIGGSSAMRELFVQIKQVAKVDTTVLLRGESGTGKELVARAIHQGSSRAKKPFISVNCAALPEGVIDSELFGHVKGAFTGALQNHKGRFELAEGGTLFLDEISELPLHLQSKLLRVLQEKEYQPLGSELTRSANVRIIAASNHNLEDDIQKRHFREDLFFRLSVFPIHLAPLRQRQRDIILLVDHFLKKNSARFGHSILRLADDASSLLMSYNWPGNVRELENVIERASIVCEDGVIYAHHLPPALQPAKSAATSSRHTLKEAVERLEQDMLYQALKVHKGNMRLAAKQLGITERQIGLRMRRYNLEYKEFRQ